MKAPDYDVIIVGAGAGGGASAWALSRLGLRVLVLEAGPAYDPASDYRLHLADWERARFPYKPGSQGRYRYELGPLQPGWERLRSWNHNYGYFNPSSQRQADAYHHVRGVGGSTLHFTGEAHRLNPAGMAMRSRFGVAADWPVTYDELEPYYCQAERLVGVAGADEDRQRPRSEPYPQPAHPPSFASRKLLAGAEALGMHWTANPVAALSQPYNDRPACNYCGQCNRGCPRTDKGSVDVTFIPAALATGRCQVLSGCSVTALVAGNDDRVREVRYRGPDGQEQVAVGRAVVVACGAVETPRLLLLSAGPQAPDGLANDSGQVGRHFMETLHCAASGLHPEALGSQRGLPSDIVCWDYNAPDAIPGVVGGCRIMPLTTSEDLSGPINYAQRVVPGWGRAHKAAMRQAYGRALTVGAIGESLPNDGTFVDLDPTEKDPLGLPIARIHSRLEDMDLQRLDFMLGRCQAVLEAAGVGEIFERFSGYDVFSATHVFGTCRMGTDPAESVVDPFCRSHRWKNLFIVDTSVFPSSGGGESPSLTVEALAIRTAGHIRDLAMRKEL